MTILPAEQTATIQDLDRPIWGVTATWLKSPATANWTTGSNWSTGSMPNETAIFGASIVTSLIISGDPSIQTIKFSIGAPAYSFFGGLTITGQGIINNSSYAPTFNNNANLDFSNTSTAGNANITGLGSLEFLNSSTADNASIVYSGIIQFQNTSTGGHASITGNYIVQFLDTSTAGLSTITQ
jgi:hypothetical protein